MPDSSATERTPLLRVENLTKHFVRHRLFSARTVTHAVCSVSFQMPPGATLGIVGESGCGKTTLLRTILGLYEPDAGDVYLDGHRLDYTDRRARMAYWRRIGTVFQDPFSSLDPHMTVSDILREPFSIGARGVDRAARVREVLDHVQLPQSALARFPHEFSGGQRQRIAIGRALVLKPELICLDEPVSSLDVTIQSDILDLLGSIQRETGTAYIFISHDLAVVSTICHSVLVMFGGQVVEAGTTAAVIGAPRHPYTQELLASVPTPDPASERARIARRREEFTGTEERTWELPPCPLS